MDILSSEIELGIIKPAESDAVTQSAGETFSLTEEKETYVAHTEPNVDELLQVSICNISMKINPC